MSWTSGAGDSALKEQVMLIHFNDNLFMFDYTTIVFLFLEFISEMYIILFKNLTKTICVDSR